VTQPATIQPTVMMTSEKNRFHCCLPKVVGRARKLTRRRLGDQGSAGGWLEPAA